MADKHDQPKIKRNRKVTDWVKFNLGIPQTLNNKLQNYVDNYNTQTTRSEVILAGLETELNKRIAEIHSYKHTISEKTVEASMAKKPATDPHSLKSTYTGRPRAAGPLDTLAASHCPVNGPCLPEGGIKT